MKEYLFIFCFLFILFLGSLKTPPQIDYYPHSENENTIIVGYSNGTNIFFQGKMLIPSAVQNTNSMKSILGYGNTVLLEKVTPDMQLNIGDIVTYRRGDSYIIHQITQIDGDTYFIKGTNTRYGETVKREQIQYRAVGVLFTNDYGVEHD